MADTLLNSTVTTTPQTLETLTGGSIVAGTAARIQNLGLSVVYYAISATLPDKSGKRRLYTDGYGSVVEFAAGENDIWLWSSSGLSVINAEDAS